MAARLLSLASIGLFSSLIFVAWTPLSQRAEVLGLTRPADALVNIHGSAPLRFIPGTQQCEDLHLHAASGLLFGGCQNDAAFDDRRKWFPPMGHFDKAYAHGGGLVVIDPKTLAATPLTLQGFSLPFVTHGIDVLDSPTEQDLVYIFAVNHLPNPSYNASAPPHTQIPKARSQVEVFAHKLHSTVATHVRSVRHPAITTPNDVLAVSPTEFYVTNDHHYREGRMRAAEDMLGQTLAAWTNTVFVRFSAGNAVASEDAEDGVVAVEALTGLHNNNGMGRAGPGRDGEILVVDASGGVMVRMARNTTLPRGEETLGEDARLVGVEPLFFPSCIDNPSYFDDPYATPAKNASGYCLAGLARGIVAAAQFAKVGAKMPVMAYHVAIEGEVQDGVEVDDGVERHQKLHKKVVFADDGNKLNSASIAVMVAIDPAKNGGKRQGDLFVSGFLSESVVVVRVDL